ncbi:hypothetical protein PAHAL_7G128300 [Panicum hallii]|uniref:Uncharacterized protein n=1 Tax=Panicum hallii TaxID=206008 RepID=A0A2S3I622_9POAL|nr:hypothetical protein PAHAL_7G128300 [Panicum hallii]
MCHLPCIKQKKRTKSIVHKCIKQQKVSCTKENWFHPTSVICCLGWNMQRDTFNGDPQPPRLVQTCIMPLANLSAAEASHCL